MTYVDGFVIPSPKRKTAAYKKLAQWGKKTWMKHGALHYFECMADDLSVWPGCGKGFKGMVKLKPNETLWFSFLVYKNKAQRDAINKKVMQEMERQGMPKSMPFDLKRMAHGGFKTIVQG
ncbi:MAG: DUF1428 domain-containing protein [Planctomycetes bacterium]|nr:DUF1428 domain-containing protein [Planctomycetota bacterium]